MTSRIPGGAAFTTRIDENQGKSSDSSTTKFLKFAIPTSVQLGLDHLAFKEKSLASVGAKVAATMATKAMLPKFDKRSGFEADEREWISKPNRQFRKNLDEPLLAGAKAALSTPIYNLGNKGLKAGWEKTQKHGVLSTALRGGPAGIAKAVVSRRLFNDMHRELDDRYNPQEGVRKVSGIAATFGSQLVTYPFDVIQKEQQEGVGVIQTVEKIYARDGFRGFTRGAIANAGRASIVGCAGILASGAVKHFTSEK